jgi:hypothetical protein
MNSAMELVGAVNLDPVGTLRFFKTPCGDYYMPNQELTGCVELICSKEIFLRGVWVKFTGFNTLISDDGIEDTSNRVDLFIGEEDHHRDGLHDVLFGFGEEDEKERNLADPMLKLDEGTHKWNFTFRIPENAPYSYCDQHTEVVYTATIYLDSPDIRMAVSQVMY